MFTNITCNGMQASYAAGIRLENVFDVTQDGGNKELVMRVKTSVENKNVFHTDLNGFHVSCLFFSLIFFLSLMSIFLQPSFVSSDAAA